MKHAFFIILAALSTLSSAQTANWNQNDDYFYSPDLSCSAGAGKVCISKADAESACKQTRSITTDALKSKDYTFSKEERDFMEAANFKVKGAFFTLGRCMIGVEWNGVMRGSSHRIRKVYGVTAFGKIKNNIVVVSVEAGPTYEQSYGELAP
jgi:hypothetical protein